MVMMRAARVTVEWPDGSTDTWEDVAIDNVTTSPGEVEFAGDKRAGSIKYKEVMLPEDKLVAHTLAKTLVESS